MEAPKDWNARFRQRRAGGLLTLLAIPLLLMSTSSIYTGAYGTSDTPPSTRSVFTGAVFCAVAFALIVIDWRLPVFRDPPDDP